jgi:hypothetical protein
MFDLLEAPQGQPKSLEQLGKTFDDLVQAVAESFTASRGKLDAQEKYLIWFHQHKWPILDLDRAYLISTETLWDALVPAYLQAQTKNHKHTEITSDFERKNARGAIRVQFSVAFRRALDALNSTSNDGEK